MTDIEKDIVNWHRATFPRATPEAILDKLKEEMIEAYESLAYGNVQNLLEEVADIFIVTCSLAARRELFEDNVTMARVIQDKMTVNKARVWGAETANGDRPRVK